MRTSRAGSIQSKFTFVALRFVATTCASLSAISRTWPRSGPLTRYCTGHPTGGPSSSGEILATTLHPLKGRLRPRTYQRLLRALAVVYGIEPMIILKDICAATDRETEAVVRWMMDALVDAALREAT